MILTVKDWLGGADNIQASKAFPSSQSTIAYDFGKDISTWSFSTNYQVIVIDTIAFNKYTGEPNFKDSEVIGYFPEQVSPIQPEIIDPVQGTLKVTIPANMYTGAILPNGRQNIPLAILSMTWTDNDGNTDSQRWLVIQAWEPTVDIGDPTQEIDYISVGV